MKKASLRVCRAFAMTLAVALAAHTPVVRAEIVDTEALGSQAQNQNQAELERAKVRSFLERADVKERLQTLGVKGLVAADRVAALSEAEVHALAQRIDALPAGGAISNQEWILILLVVIVLALVL